MKKYWVRIVLILMLCLVGTVNVSPDETSIVQARTKAGWKKVKSGFKYRKSNGKYVKGKFYKIKGKYYYFNKKGVRVTGLHTIKGKKYYFSSKGVRQKGWKTIKGKKYYFQPAAATNKWLSNNVYYVGADGACYQNGSFIIGNICYSFDANGKCIGTADYVQATDSNGKVYKLEPSSASDPRPGDATGLTEEDFMTAAVYAEAGNQGNIGQQAVALVMFNRTLSTAFPNDFRNVIYQKSQFSIASGGLLTKILTDSSLHAGTNPYYESCRQAVRQAQELVNQYLISGKTTPRNLIGFPFPAGKMDFDYLYFMTPSAFRASNLDEVLCESVTYTPDATVTSGHVFFRSFVRKN